MIGRTLDIVFELRNTLDHNVGGELSVQLEQLYNFIADELTAANLDNDVKRLDNVLDVLNTLYQGWTEAVKEVQSGKASQKAPLKETKP